MAPTSKVQKVVAENKANSIVSSLKNRRDLVKDKIARQQKENDRLIDQLVDLRAKNEDVHACSERYNVLTECFQKVKPLMDANIWLTKQIANYKTVEP